MRWISMLCFSLAAGSAFALKVVGAPGNLVGITLLSVLLAAILTFLHPIRLLGLGGATGLVLVYTRLGRTGLAGQILTLIAAAHLFAGVSLAIAADLSDLSQGENQNR